MAACPSSRSCPFHVAVEPSLIKRVKYSSAYPYCRGGMHEQCALYAIIERGERVPHDLLPNGTSGAYQDETRAASHAGYLVIEDSPVFATIAGHAIRSRVPHADVVECNSFSDAEEHLLSSDLRLVVCGYGVGEGKTAHDVRRMTSAPLVVLTGMPEDEIDVPSGARIVFKMSGPDALKAAIDAALA